MATPAAIGLRAHSGWAAAVAIARPPDPPAVIMRRRIEMLDRSVMNVPQPYHAAVGLDPDEARQLIAASAAQAANLATAALRGIVAELRSLGHAVEGCGLLLASGRSLPRLEDILASHALIHTAEGEHFREALRAASRACGLPVTGVKERDLPVEPQVAAMGKSIGPPWQQDQKLAAAAAWMVLRGG